MYEGGFPSSVVSKKSDNHFWKILIIDLTIFFYWIFCKNLIRDCIHFFYVQTILITNFETLQEDTCQQETDIKMIRKSSSKLYHSFKKNHSNYQISSSKCVFVWFLLLFPIYIYTKPNNIKKFINTQWWIDEKF